MRASREAKARHHDEIVATAARMLRGRGVECMSVVDLMRAAGLTHGGFYRHFKSKDDLVAEATRKIFQALVAEFQARSAEAGPRAALRAYVDDYLAGRHLGAPEDGCPVAAFGAEAARESRAVRAAFAQGMEQMLSLIAEGMSGAKAQQQARAAELQALLVGAVIMARVAGSTKLARDILDSARQRARQMIEERR
jgi:TetR/AcrR family transcriptional repressor of nem operon